MLNGEVKRAYELASNMKDFDKQFLIHLYNQSFPGRPYDFNAPYKKIRYVLNKYIELGVLELNTWGWECEINVNFTRLGDYILAYIEGREIN